MASPEPLTVRSGRIKRTRRLATRRFRTEEREFLAEGPQAVREAIASDNVLEVFATQDAHQKWESAGESRGPLAWTIVNDDVIVALSDTVQTQGVVARCRFVDTSLEYALMNARLVAVCVDIRDPGNAGTVIRCADAAGADAVVFAGDSVDPYNAKAVRASAGSLFHLPIAAERDVAVVFEQLRVAGLQLLATAGAGETDLFDADLTAPTAWIFGNEAHGLPEAFAAEADARVAIPIYGRAESLNLATATAVCLYSSARAQRTR